MSTNTTTREKGTPAGVDVSAVVWLTADGLSSTTRQAKLAELHPKDKQKH